MHFVTAWGRLALKFVTTLEAGLYLPKLEELELTKTAATGSRPLVVLEADIKVVETAKGAQGALKGLLELDRWQCSAETADLKPKCNNLGSQRYSIMLRATLHKEAEGFKNRTID